MNNKQKFYMVIVGAVLFIFISYSLSVKKTVSIISENKKIQGQLGNIENTPGYLFMLQNELDVLNNQIGSNIERDYKQYLIFKISSQNKSDISLKDIPPPNIILDGNINVKTYKITLQGKFNSLLELLHSFELDPNIRKIHSVSFQKIVDHKNKTSNIEMTVYIQKIFHHEKNI